MAVAELQRAQLMATTDPEFRTRLLADPRAALASLGIEIHDDIHINIVEDDPKTLTLPIYPIIEGVQLSDEQLTKLSGGLGADSLDVVEAGFDDTEPHAGANWLT